MLSEIPDGENLWLISTGTGVLDMATIGTFTKPNSGFTGSIQTVGLKAKVAITPVEKHGETAADCR